MTPPQLKKALIQAGFEVFRTLPEEVVLADRVRENLILDSGVRVRADGEGFRLRVVFRAERRDFPGEGEGELFARVRKLAEEAIGSGYTEESTNILEVKDPSDDARTLDTFFEVILHRKVDGTLETVGPTIREALAFEKAAAR